MDIQEILIVMAILCKHIQEQLKRSISIALEIYSLF